jgi:hypothetical protein
MELIKTGDDGTGEEQPRKYKLIINLPPLAAIVLK